MKKDDLRLDPATEHDVPAILALLARCNLPVAGWREHLATTLVARDHDTIIGCIALELHGTSALLRSAAVDETRRRQGLGSALTDAALALAKAQKIRSVYLLTETAGAFFPKFGFQRIAREDVPDEMRRSVEFTTACPASALVMALTIFP